MAKDSNKTILVTGAAGLLGREVVDGLLAAGDSIVALDRVPAEMPAGVRFVEDDLSSRERLEALFVGISDIVHCAAYAHLQSAREDIVFNGNVTTTANLVYAAEAAGVKRLVYASSQSALGLAYASEIIPPDRLPVDEDHPPRPHEGYALSKLVGEQLCRMVSGRSALVTVMLRFPVIWSAHRFAEHVGKRLGDPRQAAKSQWAYVDLRDAARACRMALEAPDVGATSLYNIAAPWLFGCDEAEATIVAAYGSVPRKPGWRPGDAVYDARRAEVDFGFRAIWRWLPTGIDSAPANHDAEGNQCKS